MKGCGLIWNARGVGNRPTQRRIKSLIQEYKLCFVALLEPMLDSRKAEKICRRLNMDFYFSQGAGTSKILVLWRHPLEFRLYHSHDQIVTFEALDQGQAISFFSFVYARCQVSERQALWTQLRNFSLSISKSWIIGGDFNTILYSNEKLGGNPPEVRSMDDFHYALSSANLMDAGYLGSKYTWCNNQEGPSCIRARLDRCLVNSEWVAQFSSTTIQHLSITLSDHAPLQVSFRDIQSNEPRPFRFQQMWISHAEFQSVVKQSWEAPIYASPLSRLVGKLKGLKKDQQAWNKSTFGNLYQNLALAEDEVLEAQKVYDEDPSPAHIEQLNGAKSRLLEVQLQEEVFWKQKAHMRWLQEGDRNTHLSIIWRCGKGLNLL